MELILASASGVEECVLNCEYDFEVGGTNTFELTIPTGDWTGAIGFGKRVYSPGTEVGGIVNVIESDTAEDVIRVRGTTWRGLLYKRLYNGTPSGDLHTVIRNMIGYSGDVLVVSNKSTGINVTGVTFDYVSAGEAIDAILKGYGYKLSMRYVQTDDAGYVAVEAVPATIITDEVSQDALLEFIITDDRSGVNHMICIKEGTVVAHLYADANGNISQNQTYFGIDEVQDYFESDKDDIIEEATEQLAELTNRAEMSISVADSADLSLSVGDYVTGHDFITGIEVTKQITSIIMTLRDNEETIEYLVEE